MKTLFIVFLLSVSSFCQAEKQTAELTIIYSYGDWWNKEEAKNTLKEFAENVSDYLDKFELSEFEVIWYGKRDGTNYYKMELNFQFDDWDSLDETTEYIRNQLEIFHFFSAVKIKVFRGADKDCRYECSWYDGLGEMIQ